MERALWAIWNTIRHRTIVATDRAEPRLSAAKAGTGEESRMVSEPQPAGAMTHENRPMPPSVQNVATSMSRHTYLSSQKIRS
jgi:hypothetical protein